MVKLRTIDDKGRLTLGRAFAGKTVQVEKQSDGVYFVRLFRAVPEPEGWLWENAEAMALVQLGLAEATDRKFVPGPNLDAAFGFAETIPDEE
jgi:hypothetical protein